MKVRKLLSMVVVAAMSVGIIAGCGNSSDKSDSNAGTNSGSGIKGTVSTNGSTSMENVISSLIEAFTSFPNSNFAIICPAAFFLLSFSF